MSELRTFVDDPSIADEDVLYRAVPPLLIENWDTFGGRHHQIPSRAWQDHRESTAAKWGLAPCASVAVARILEQHGRDVTFWLETFFLPSYGVVQIAAGALRRATSHKGDPVPQGVMLHATIDQPWHAVVWSRRGTKRNKTEMRALTALSKWFRPPDQHDTQTH
jgi:hypothetical protein